MQSVFWRITREFLIVAPGLTIRDQLQVLQSNDPNGYYESREIVPREVLPAMGRAKIVITNYHSFKLNWTRSETEGQMIQRVMPDPMDLENVIAINDVVPAC